ncbi:DnaJ domain-containing protein [Stappia taiwanensis]|uniref:DnaJ domain-containing protein n=1 Tax=Stappia taiwanensis TaxID=992267 RepID=A0A838XH02_9HYPH|nr:DnaJ domain-containing protein [Stappia taiwanensis]MBA4610669.1 DnaJ domain-containing protein [Stappia taiwanensis]GGE83148.1 molecular chaperone DnaJ [Stappia taiwanensis]
MGYLLLGIVLLALLVAFGNALATADTAKLARQLKLAGGVVLMLLAGVLVFARRWDLAMLVGAVGLSLLGWGRARGFRPAGGASAGAGQVSEVRSAFLVMRLDHGTGDMEGEVVAGTFAGRALASFASAELERLYREVAADGDSGALLEAYLDRRQPGWRVDFEANGAAGQGAAPGPSAMTEEEAYQVLGLEAGASEAEIRAAHRRLMKRLHPDQGGSGFLAAKLNEAKDLLVGRH